MRRSEYEQLLTHRHRWPQEIHGAPRRFLTTFVGAAFLIGIAIWLVLTFFGG
jgi:hypothetical protein